MAGLNRNWQREVLLPAVENRRGEPFKNGARQWAKDFHRRYLPQYLKPWGWTGLVDRCMACGRSGETLDLVFHLDHRIPRSAKGPNTLFNSEVLCAECNWEKNATDWACFLHQKARQNFSNPQKYMDRVITYFTWVANEVKCSPEAMRVDLALAVGPTQAKLLIPASTIKADRRLIQVVS